MLSFFFCYGDILISQQIRAVAWPITVKVVPPMLRESKLFPRSVKLGYVQNRTLLKHPTWRVTKYYFDWLPKNYDYKTGVNSVKITPVDSNRAPYIWNRAERLGVENTSFFGQSKKQLHQNGSRVYIETIETIWSIFLICFILMANHTTNL